MRTESKWKGSLLRALSVSVGGVLVLLTASGLQGATLWSNGNLTSNVNSTGNARCDSVCNGIAWTVFDNFNVPSGSLPWVVSGFDFTDFLVGTPTSDYVNTKWSIWKGDPLGGGTLVASGTASGASVLLSTVNGTCGSICLEMFTVTLGAPVQLAAGSTYFLGLSNTLANPVSESSMRAFATGGNSAAGGAPNGFHKWEQSNGTTTGVPGSSWSAGGGETNFPIAGSVPEFATAFDIQATLAPEPGTLTLLSFALVGLGFALRRRAA